jgi:hypothetical protein
MHEEEGTSDMSEAHARFGKRPQVAAPLLEEIARQAELVAAGDAATAGPQWGAMHKLLLKAKVDPHAIMRLVGARDGAGLADLVRWLRGEEIAAPEPEAPAVEEIDIETQRAAMRVFRKRLRLARLDAESRLGGGKLTGGKHHGIDAIVAPREYPMKVWAALVAAGRLRSDGKGFFSLAVDDLDDV